MTRFDRVRWLLLTGLGTGKAPVAPGTFGTLPGVVLAIVIGAVLPPSWVAWVLLGVGLCLFVFGAGQTKFVERTWPTEDPGTVVLDEIVGYLVMAGLFAVFAGAPGVWAHVVGFVAFRVFDVLKPPPADRLEELPGAVGIMADDVMAGVYAALVLLVADALGFLA